MSAWFFLRDLHAYRKGRQRENERLTSHIISDGAFMNPDADECVPTQDDTIAISDG